MPITPTNPFKGRQYPGELILLCVRWYLRYPLAYEHVGVSRSQPVGGVIEKINPILRGWVQYFAIGHSSRCFSYIRYWVEKKIRRHLARACQRSGFGWKRWSREWLYGTWACFRGTACRISRQPLQSSQPDRSHKP
jgi:hypothetical protein